MTSLKIKGDLLNYILGDMIGKKIEGVGRRHMKRANEIRAGKESFIICVKGLYQIRDAGMRETKEQNYLTYWTLALQLAVCADPARLFECPINVLASKPVIVASALNCRGIK